MNAYFEKLKQNLELSPSFEQIVQTRHAAVRSAIANRGAEIKETKLIGSLQRKTRIQPRQTDQFDIDIVIVLGEFHSWLPVGDPNGITPERALNYVHGSVQGSDRYSSKNPQRDAPTIALQFADEVKVELVPAYVDMIGQNSTGTTHSPKGRGYWIPKNGRWELADYDFEAAHVTEKNLASEGYLVPTIKMLKSIKRLHFPYLGSFPLEVLAAQAIPSIVAYQRQNNQTITYPDLIRLFFVLGKDWVGTPIKIVGSNSTAVNLDPATAQSLRTMFDNVIAHIQGIERMSNQAGKISAWKQLFGEAFPTTVIT
jgi:hypothetical protein